MSSDVGQELKSLEGRFIAEYDAREGTELSQDAAVVADAVIASLPDSIKDRLMPEAPNEKLRSKALDLFNAAGSVLDSVMPDENHPLAKTLKAWSSLQGNLRSHRYENLTIGAWVAENLVMISGPRDKKDVAEIVAHYAEGRFHHRGATTIDERLCRSTGAFISEALKSMKGYDGYEDVKQASIAFKQQEQSLNLNDDGQELGR